MAVAAKAHWAKEHLQHLEWTRNKLKYLKLQFGTRWQTVYKTVRQNDDDDDNNNNNNNNFSGKCWAKVGPKPSRPPEVQVSGVSITEGPQYMVVLS